MTKRSKKEERLSPRAKDLINTAKNKYSTQPKKAIEYLQSIPAQQLNLYDRQKIGREILARHDALKKINWFTSVETTEDGRFVRQIMEDYQIKAYPRTSDRYQLAESSTSGRHKVLTQQNHLRDGQLHLAHAEKAERNGNEDIAIREYAWAGASFTNAGVLDRAISAYKHELELIKNFDPNKYLGIGRKSEQEKRHTIDLYFKNIVDGSVQRDIEQAIEKLEKEKRTRQKSSVLEQSTATASIVGVLGGIFFLSSNITGNAIADLTTKTTSFLGAGLLIVGLVAGWFWLNN